MAKKTILVTGDPICDCNFYEGDRTHADQLGGRGFRVADKQPGGALLLHRLIEILEPGARVEFGLDIDPADLPEHYHSYCLWKPCIANPADDKDKQRHIWRAVEPLLGYGNHDADAVSRKLKRRLGARRSHVPNPDILVIDDGGLDFRNLTTPRRWPVQLESNKGPRPTWVILKLSSAVGQGDLWKSLTKYCKDNLVVIVSADQLRRSDVRLSTGLSWEATIEDLRAELNTNPAVMTLREARHLIVTFGSDGAFWLDKAKDPKCTGPMFVFDGMLAEGEWAAGQGKGTAFGYLSCFTAAVVSELANHPKDPNFAGALISGLDASRELHRLGHGPITLKVKDAKGTAKTTPNPSPGFPYRAIAARIRKAVADSFVCTQLPPERPNARRGRWMMLDEWQFNAAETERRRPYHHAAFACAVLGTGVLERFPVARFGRVRTVDRQEIESLRILRRLMENYERSQGPKIKPLNIGVFGPPGAGKSFGVKEIAKAAFGKDVPFLTFNLSQFSQAADLIGALHQVRDKVLAGTTPIIFWDEFDSENYKWLQYLLAPMNDGEFIEGPITHPIGKCIFIFAGATSFSYETFGPINPDDPADPLCAQLETMSEPVQQAVRTQWMDFVMKKGPDFKSRLVTYLNVLGPNCRLHSPALNSNGQRKLADDPEDLCWPLRRAFFIRDVFDVKDDERLNIDHGVLRAMLEIPKYKCGSRSLEFLCNYLRHHVRTHTPRRSQLPGNHLLDMHINADEFWRICERDLEFRSIGASLAPALHEEYRLRIKGNKKKKHLDVPFEKLHKDKKDANVAQALRIPEILKIAGMELHTGPIVPLKYLVSDRTPGDNVLRALLAELPTLELLAEAEHNGWMVERMLQGWRYSAKRDDKALKHDSLIPYNQLSKDTQDLDRATIIGKPPRGEEAEQFGYIDIVKTAGFRVRLMQREKSPE